MKSIIFSMLLALSLFLVLAHVSDAVVSCSTVTMKAAPCVGFTTGKSPKPTAASPCCTGLKQLAQMTKSVPDKKAACQCLKTSGKNLGIMDKFLTQLPTICNINVGFPISANTNCAAAKVVQRSTETRAVSASKLGRGDSFS